MDKGRTVPPWLFWKNVKLLLRKMQLLILILFSVAFQFVAFHSQTHLHTYSSIPHIPPPPQTHAGRRPCSPQSPVCTHISRWGRASLRLHCSTSWEARTPPRRSRTCRGLQPGLCLPQLLCQGTGPGWVQWVDISCKRLWLRPGQCKHQGPGRPGKSLFCSNCWCLWPPCWASWPGHQHPPAGKMLHIVLYDKKKNRTHSALFLCHLCAGTCVKLSSAAIVSILTYWLSLMNHRLTLLDS